MPPPPDNSRLAAEIVIVLVLSAVIAFYLLSQLNPGATPSQSAAMLAAFYYPMSFPVEAVVKSMALEKRTAVVLTLCATVVLQNGLLWLVAQWLRKPKGQSR